MNLKTRQTIGGLFSILLLLAFNACDSEGEAIYFASDRDGQWDIYYSDPNAKEQFNLTDSPFADEYPVLSPNRILIAFSVSKDAKDLNVGSEVMKLKEGEKISGTTGLGT